MRGNPGGRQIKPHEPKPVGDLKEPPAHFDAEMRTVWDYAIAHAPPGLLKRLDASVLETWCTAQVLHRRALKAMGKQIVVNGSKRGVRVESPYLAILNRQAMIMLRAGEQLGFSPASRTRISVPPKSNLGGWEDIAAG